MVFLAKQQNCLNNVQTMGRLHAFLMFQGRYLLNEIDVSTTQKQKSFLIQN